MSPSHEATPAEQLNTDCFCVTLDTDALCRQAETVVGDPAFCRDLAVTHPHLLSAQPLFVSADHALRMQAIIAAIETVVRLPGYQSAVLAQAPEIARFEPGPIGVFMGYDFHLAPDGPKLIEINTNAGGALLNAYLLQAQRACCTELGGTVPFNLRVLLDRFVAGFTDEWRRQGRTGPWQSVAIIDEAPTGQYLYPEFVLFQRLFEQHGLRAIICAPTDLSLRDGELRVGSQRIDLVYNRLTDFAFARPEHQALRDAYLAGSVVVTPNPRAHALFADKRNLVHLTDSALLATWGARDAVIATLEDGIPRTELVAACEPDALWKRRDGLFFKPRAGFGGRAAYRGDKVTKKVWAEILAGDYVAQRIVPPSGRTVLIDGRTQVMKVDLRNYTYDGQVQLVAARLYQGQTTNFRTSGGGFAPVVLIEGAADCACPAGTA